MLSWRHFQTKSEGLSILQCKQDFASFKHVFQCRSVYFKNACHLVESHCSRSVREHQGANIRKGTAYTVQDLNGLMWQSEFRTYSMSVRTTRRRSTNWQRDVHSYRVDQRAAKMCSSHCVTASLRHCALATPGKALRSKGASGGKTASKLCWIHWESSHKLPTNFLQISQKSSHKLPQWPCSTLWKICTLPRCFLFAYLSKCQCYEPKDLQL